MRNDRDYYVILQVDPQAEQEVIEAAYRRLAAKYHPDHNPSPEAGNRMKLINAAYEVLSSLEKRRDYDLYRGQFSHRQRGTVQVGRKGYLQALLTVTLVIAPMALLSRSPILLLILVILIFFLFLLWRTGRPQSY